MIIDTYRPQLDREGNWKHPACIKWTYGRAVLRQGLPDIREVDGSFLFELGQMALLSALPRNVDLRASNEVITDIRKNLREFSEVKENREDLPDAVPVAEEIVKALTAVREKIHSV